MGQKVKSTPGKVESEPLDLKLSPVKQETITMPEETESQKPVGMKSTPVKVTGDPQEVKSTRVKVQNKSECTPVKGRSKEKYLENEKSKAKPGR